jgi:putative Mn2+ efflux pump MntP
MADWLLTLIIAVSLAMDCFAVSLGIGCSLPSCDKRAVFRLSFHFGFFQGGMTLLGWLVGNTILPYKENFDHWIAFLLLAWIGIRMIREGLSKETETVTGDPTRGGTLILLSIATSIDALGVGLSLSILQTNIAFSSIMIGFVSFLFTIIGLRFGNRLNNKFGKKIEILGGLVLLIIGSRLLLSHLHI